MNVAKFKVGHPRLEATDLAALSCNPASPHHSMEGRQTQVEVPEDDAARPVHHFAVCSNCPHRTSD